MKLQPRPAATLAEIARDGLGLRAEDLPRGVEELRAVVIAETVRIGLCHLYQQNGNMPVHHLRLRNWVGRKLEAALPDVFVSPDAIDYRDVLIDGSGGNMEYLGDILSLSGGMLCPAPARAIPAGGTDFILTSGLPTASLEQWRANIRFNLMGRRLVNVTPSQLQEAKIRIRTVERFLNAERHASSPTELLSNVLRQDPEQWHPDEKWECYQGNKRDFDMRFHTRARSFPAGDGHEIELWRRPLGRTYYEYWLRDLTRPTEAYRVASTEWIRACIALDYLAGDPRVAYFREEDADGVIRLNFNPWGLFWRWLLLQGARGGNRQGANRVWVVPAPSLKQGAGFLQRVGVRVIWK